MAVAILQAKSMLVNLEAQVGRHLLEENPGLHFAMLESREGAISNSFSLPGFRHCPSIPLWMELQRTQHTFSSEQTHTFNDNKMWLRKTRSEQKHIPRLSLQISLQSKNKLCFDFQGSLAS